MDPYRIKRQNTAIQKVLSELIASDVKDPRVGFVTVNGVELNRDQTVAKVFVSVLGDPGEVSKSLRGLKKARGYLQGRLSDILRLRSTPDLRFIHDDTLEKGMSVDEILSDLADKGEFKDEAERNRDRDLASLEPPLDLMKAIERGRTVWVVPHWNPDPDAMGSALALGEALSEMGKDVTVLRYPDAPAGFPELPGFDATPEPEDLPGRLESEDPDLLLLTDCHDLSRTGDYADFLSRIPDAWCIDHHLLGSRAPLPGWIEPLACAASLLVMRVIEELLPEADGEVLTLTMAENLYAGIVADTGGFRYPNTLPLTFEAAHRLSRMGIDTSRLAEKLLYQRSRAGLQLLQAVFPTFEFHADGRILSLHVTQEMIRAAGATLSDTEGFISLAAGVDGLEFVVFLKDQGDDVWRVSLRSLGEGDVQDVAAGFGGGGHRQASGCTISGDVASLTEELVGLLADQL